MHTAPHTPHSQSRAPFRGPDALALLGLLLLLCTMGGRPGAARAQTVPKDAQTEGLPSDAQAKYDDLRPQPMSPGAQANGGIQFVRSGHPSAALPLLQKAVAARPTFVHPTHGSAAYWLGEAYARLDSTDRAHSVWSRGVHRFDEAGRFDSRLADAYLRTLSPKELRNERRTAVEAYATLLHRVGTDTSAAMRSLFRRRVAQIAPLMPDDVFARVVEGPRDAPASWTFRPDAGEALRGWWNGLDPYPATSENERLEEHLMRLVHARNTFACSERPSALDDRGTIHLRLGPPFNRHELSYKNGKFFKDVFRFGVPIPPSAFPDSEIWVYPRIDESAHYLFAETDTSDCFVIATANDLLPNTLKMRRNDTERGLNIAYSSLKAMQAIYSELALYHPHFSSRYADIASYADVQEMNTASAEVAKALGKEHQSSGMNQVEEVGSGVGQTRFVVSNPNLGIEFPTQFVPKMVAQAEREDAAAAQRRQETIPSQQTALHADTTRLPVALRTARFLTADGATRTEVYWGVSASDAQLVTDRGEPVPSLIRFSAVRHDADRSQAQRKQQRVQVPTSPSQQRSHVVGPPVTFEGTTPHHLLLQWAQFPVLQGASSAVSSVGSRQRFALARADSLEPLRSRGGLEVSDLKVLTLPDTSAATLTALDENATPYPFRTLSPDTPLLLAFDVYHLTYGADDRTHYTVSYEVEGKAKDGWTQLFQDSTPQRTRTTMSREGTSRRSDERILVDLSEIERDDAQDVRVSVRVTDETTGRTVTRSLDFVLSPSQKQ